MPRENRRLLAMFRAGSLPLAIETGRYSRPQIPLEQRICAHCGKNEIENEMHFLIECSLYDDLRFDFFQLVSSYITNFCLMSREDKFKQIMNCNEMSLSVHCTMQVYNCTCVYVYFMHKLQIFFN